MKIITMLALAASLSACATTATRVQRLDVALTRIEAGYRASRSVAELFLPWLPRAQAARLRALGDGVEISLAAVRHARDIARRRAALRQAEAAAAAFRLPAGN